MDKAKDYIKEAENSVCQSCGLDTQISILIIKVLCQYCQRNRQSCDGTPIKICHLDLHL